GRAVRPVAVVGHGIAVPPLVIQTEQPCELVLAVVVDSRPALVLRRFLDLDEELQRLAVNRVAQIHRSLSQASYDHKTKAAGVACGSDCGASATAGSAAGASTSPASPSSPPATVPASAGQEDRAARRPSPSRPGRTLRNTSRAGLSPTRGSAQA